MKPILVGELNPYGPDPGFALYPSPPGCAGDRLCRLMGLDSDDYLDRFDRANLCDYRWSVRKARERAESLLDASENLVLLGSKVCDAFQIAFTPFRIVWRNPKIMASPRRLFVLPHPSGRNRMWNVPGAFERAQGILGDLLR
jgi:hypothetical protein